MSAINPASFASQPLGFQAPSGIGPGAVGVSRAVSTSERRQPQQGGHISPPPPLPQSRQQQQQPQQRQPVYSPSPTNFGYSGGVSPQPQTPASNGSSAYPLSFPYTSYAALGNVPRASTQSYGQSMSPSHTEAYAMGYAAPADYQRMRSRFFTDQTDVGQTGQGLPTLASNDWLGSFQSLSLNTR